MRKRNKKEILKEKNVKQLNCTNDNFYDIPLTTARNSMLCQELNSDWFLS